MKSAEIKETTAPLISIVIVNYNYGQFLEQAIQSVVDQDEFDCAELIVVDGGSTDNSVEVIRSFEDSLSWWVSEKDEGQSDAFNKGFAHAHGRFGCWLNADDIMLPGTLSAVQGCIMRHPEVRWMTGGTVFFNADGNVFKISRLIGDLANRLLRIPCWMQIVAPSTFFDIQLLRAAGGFDTSLRYVMDIDLWMNFERQGARLYHIGRYCWGFRAHEQSKTAASVVSGEKDDRFKQESSLVRARYGYTRKREKMSLFRARVYGVLSCGFLRRRLLLAKICGKKIVNALEVLNG